MVEGSEVVERLDTIVTILKLVHNKAIQEYKDEAFKSGYRRRTYDLCDGKKTQKEIVERFNPKKPYNKVQPDVSKALSELEQLGLVRARVSGKEKIYFKIL
jgi:DNA-binding transcriptional ArsR family regulator